MKKIYLTGLIIMVGIFNSLAQTDSQCACCSENHRAFDFWIGDWTVYNSDGIIVGTNKVVKLQDDCVLQENWVASGKNNTGTSYNFYDSSDHTWNQVWISNSGNVLNLKGNIDKNGYMILKSDMVKSSKGNYYNQITWSKKDDGSVIQQWDLLNEEGEKISEAFKGIYKKQDDRISTIDFVQYLNDNKDEAVYYYQNNWKILREMALVKGYIYSFEIIQTPFSESQPFDLMLITTYSNKEQYELREHHFRELIQEKGELSFMNEKKPNEFKKTLFSKEKARHLK